MITKKQWDKLLSDMSWLKNQGFDIYINGNKVIKVDHFESLIYTKYYQKDVDGSFIRQRYTYEESINQYMTLNDLYQRVSFQVTMKDIFRGTLADEFKVDRVLADSKVGTNKVVLREDKDYWSDILPENNIAEYGDP